MVDHEKQRARYLAGAEGAPPVPPPGGYQGARRTSASPVGGGMLSAPVAQGGEARAVEVAAERPPTNAIGWVALIGSILFGIILLGAMFVGGTGLLYGTTMLTLQLLVVGVIIAGLCTARGRVLAASALAVSLLFNVATVGAMSAVQTSASGSYEGQKTPEQKHQEAYPGIKDTSNGDVLAGPSLEDVRAESESALREIRERLTAEFGFTWTQTGDETLRPERNGYGGESMLVEYMSGPWMTNEPVQGFDRKRAVLRVVEDVIVDHGLYELYAFNDPASGLDPSILEKFYGSTDPRTQSTWESYSDDYPGPKRFYAVTYDLSQDASGELRREREAQAARTGEPLEGLQIYFLAPELLSESDRAEFEERLKEYPGF